MKDSAILSSELILFILASLRKPQQSICSCICFALAVVDLKMVSGELLGPADLSGAQTLRIHEATKVVVVCEDEHLVLATFQIVTPCLEGFDDSQKLAVVGLISSLCQNHFSQKERYRMPLAQISLSDYPIWPSFRG